jgi:hypothetical protein
MQEHFNYCVATPLHSLEETFNSSQPNNSKHEENNYLLLYVNTPGKLGETWLGLLMRPLLLFSLPAVSLWKRNTPLQKAYMKFVQQVPEKQSHVNDTIFLEEYKFYHKIK